MQYLLSRIGRTPCCQSQRSSTLAPPSDFVSMITLSSVTACRTLGAFEAAIDRVPRAGRQVDQRRPSVRGGEHRLQRGREARPSGKLVDEVACGDGQSSLIVGAVVEPTLHRLPATVLRLHFEHGRVGVSVDSRSYLESETAARGRVAVEAQVGGVEVHGLVGELASAVDVEHRQRRTIRREEFHQHFVRDDVLPIRSGQQRRILVQLLECDVRRAHRGVGSSTPVMSALRFGC